MALQVWGMGGNSPGYREMVRAIPRLPGGLEADHYCNPDPPLPPPDFHHNAYAHGYFSDGGGALAKGHHAPSYGHAATRRSRHAKRGFVLRDSSGGNTIAWLTAASANDAREV